MDNNEKVLQKVIDAANEDEDTRPPVAEDILIVGSIHDSMDFTATGSSQAIAEMLRHYGGTASIEAPKAPVTKEEE